MRSTLTVLITLLLFTTQFSWAQTPGTIKGRVLTSDGKPAEFSSVSLKGIKTKTVDKNGYFAFEVFEGGAYTLEVNTLDLQAESKQVVIKPGETVTIDFRLSANARTLNEIVIIGDKYHTSVQKPSPYVARLPLRNLENPQVYNVIDKELIREQMAITVDESFRNVPGVAPAKTGAGMPSFFSRGFQTSENLRDGMATNLKTGVDLALVDRVEILKGPSATLYGGVLTSFGGIVNYVTKKPLKNFVGEVSYTAGSFNLNRLTVDINTPINEDKTALFRINAATQKENSFQDQGYGTSYVVAPSLAYRINDKLDFLLSADIQTYKGTVQPGWWIGADVTAKNFEELNLNYKRSYNDNSLIGSQTSANFTAQANYQLSKSWKSQTTYATGTGEYNDFYIYDLNVQSNTEMTRLMRVFAPEKGGRHHFQQNFNGDYRLLGLRNRIVVGLDYMQTFRNFKYTGVYPDGSSTTRILLNETIPSTRIERVNSLVSAVNTQVTIQNYYNFAAYVSDAINITDKVIALLSLRADRIINRGSKNSLTYVTTGRFTQNALSPKLGLVYEALPEQLSLFGNYMWGFKNVAPFINPDQSLVFFEPQWAKQLEGGLKFNLLSNKLNGTLSYYDIQVSNSIRPATVNGLASRVQDGEQESKGMELEIIANPLPGLNLISGYGYNQNKFTTAAENINGKRALGTPKHVANIWASYSLLNGAAKGLGIGAGTMYVSDSYFNDTNTFTLESYTIVDASLFYNTPKYRISVKGNNLLNEKYWITDSYYARPQKPANFQVAVAYKLTK